MTVETAVGLPPQVFRDSGVAAQLRLQPLLDLGTFCLRENSNNDSCLILPTSSLLFDAAAFVRARGIDR
jgi:hypothetical protein